MKRALVIGTLAVGLAAASALSIGAAPRVAKPPTGLTASGRVLWNFEGLLTRTFKKGFGVKVQGLGFPPNFVEASRCPSLAACDGYRLVFARHSTTAFHLTAAAPKGSFGVHPALVRVHGAYVACNAKSSLYLITYSDTMNFALDCLRPH